MSRINTVQVHLDVESLSLAHQVILTHLRVDSVVRSDPDMLEQFRNAEADLRHAREQAVAELVQG